MKARVFITLKNGVLDPQGKAIEGALGSLGFAGVNGVRQGKYFELEIAAATADEARKIATEVSQKVLANPVIESFRVDIDQKA